MDRRRLLVIVVCSFACAYVLHVISAKLRLNARIDEQAIIPTGTVPPISRSLRPNYPYSVIPGGVYSVDELVAAVGKDHLVGNHYSGFNLKSAHLVTLTEDRLQYVSYRLKNQIYWTRNKLRIPKGEVLLTDGSSFARTRCGNRLSSESRPETSREQPAARILSLPPFTPALLTTGQVKLGPPPPLTELVSGAPVLPLDLPRLAPYLPEQGGEGGLVSQQIWPSIQPPGGLGFVAAGPPIGSGYLPAPPGSSPTPPLGVGPLAPGLPGTPSSPGSPGSPGLPISPILPVAPTGPGSPTPPVSEVPEPASVSLLAISFGGWLWLLTRVMGNETRSSPAREFRH